MIHFYFNNKHLNDVHILINGNIVFIYEYMDIYISRLNYYRKNLFKNRKCKPK